MSSLKKNIISLFILQGGNYLVPLITFPYLVRTLGVDAYGEFGVTFSICQYLMLVTDFGFNLSASKNISIAHGDKVKISKIFYSTMCCKLILFACVSIVVLLFYCITVGGINYPLLFSLMQVLGSVLLPIWFFQGIEKMSYVAISSIIAKIIVLPLVFLFVKSQDDLSVAVVIQSLSFLLSAFFSLYFIKNENLVTFKKTSLSDIVDGFKDSYQIFIAGFAISLYTASTPIIIKLFSSSSEVGVFSAGDKLRSALMGCILILGHAFYPRVNSLFSISKENAFIFVRKIFYIQSTITISIGFLLYVFSDVIVEKILGTGYERAALILKIQSPLFFFVTQSVVFANYLLLPLGHKREYTILPIATSILHIIMCSYFCSKIGGVGGAVSILAVEVITFFWFLYVLYQKKILKSWLMND